MRDFVLLDIQMFYDVSYRFWKHRPAEINVIFFFFRCLFTEHTYWGGIHKLASKSIVDKRTNRTTTHRKR